MSQLENNFPLVSCQLLMCQIVEPPRASMFYLKTMDMLQIVFLMQWDLGICQIEGIPRIRSETSTCEDFLCFMSPFHYVNNQMICARQNHFCIWGAFMSSGLLHCTNQITLM
jgi:hypothetical protein